MTISSTNRKAGPFTGNGVTTAFPFAFKVFVAADVLVAQAVTATGVETTKALTADYTIAINADQNANPGGTITMLVAPPTGTTLTATSQVANLQPLDVTNGGGFYPSVLNSSFDRATIQIQQLAEKVGRTLQFTLSNNGPSALPVSGDRANQLLGFDGAGNPVTVVPASGSASDLALQLVNATDPAKGAALVGHNDALAYGAGTVGAALRKLNQAQSGQFYANLGGKVNRLADRLFVGDAVVHDGKEVPIVATWVNSVSSGIYEYLERAATLVAPAYKAGIGTFSAARSSTGAGTAGDASIGVAGFAYNDYAAGAAGAWALYGTSLRKAGTNGATHGIEVDIANAGSLVQLYPSAMFLAGQTHGAWICSGGESTATAGLVGTASLAIGIISNDPAKIARFDKGIVFENKSIAGTDGVTGNGIAIAFAARHQQLWFNNSNQVVAELVGNAVTAANALRLDMSDFGLLVQNRTTGATQFQVENTPSAANYLTMLAGATPQIVVNGSGANVDWQATPKGTGVFKVGYGSAAATTPANFSAARALAVKDANNIIYYIPLATTLW